MAKMMTRRRNILTFLLGMIVGLIPFILHSNNSDPQVDYIEQVADWPVAGDSDSRGFSFFNRHGSYEPRKIFLDCGANSASTVEFFRNTYPDGKDYIIHSFEIDQRLAPYFSPYQKLHLHCPVAVSSKDGFATAYSESVWSRDRGLNNGLDMLWGGGTLFVTDDEAKDVITGGNRKLSVRTTIPTIDLSLWIQQNTRKEDYVIFKLDVEGAEFDILEKMVQDDTFKWIDKLYGEFHLDQPVPGWTNDEKENFADDLGDRFGIGMIDWEAETRNYDDFNEMHPVKVPKTEPGRPGNLYSFCGKTTNKLALTIAVGMNAKRARKIASIITSYPVEIPVMFFVYGDFAELFPDDVKRWANRHDVGMREDGHYPSGHFETLDMDLVSESIISAQLRLQDLGIQPRYYFPMNAASGKLRREGWRQGFRIVAPAVEFPPKQGFQFTVENYYQYRDVERVPKALRMLDSKLNQTRGGVLTLDTDVPDTRLILVFLLDYLTQTSGYDLVSVFDCVEAYDGCVGECPYKMTKD